MRTIDVNFASHFEFRPIATKSSKYRADELYLKHVAYIIAEQYVRKPAIKTKAQPVMTPF